ncbi:MAG TPA: choice-of-anchor L domain-containing protein [Nannocystis sp.]
MRVPGLAVSSTVLFLLTSACGGDDGPRASASDSASGTSGITGVTTPGGPGTDTSQDPTDGGATSGGACTPADCPSGQYCDGVGCQPGCDEDSDCVAPATCDVGDHVCKGCETDEHCGSGTVCVGGACLPGCDDAHPCSEGLACCAGSCVDLTSDPEHCGSCEPCQAPPHAQAICTMAQCGVGPCEDGWSDCDGDPNNGCETAGSCQCEPGATQPCYSGPPGTEGVGVCKAGTQTCNAQGTGWGACEGEVVPGPMDICGNGLDDDCNNLVDDDPDADGDGWTVCGGDCCDEVGPDCLDPGFVNPGAFEVMGNQVDDNCDGMKDNVLPPCDANLASNSADALDYARAMDLCQFTEENPADPKDRIWGVISGSFFRSNGMGTPANNAKSIRPGFGAVITPQKNSSLVVLSTGAAADSNDVSPNYQPFQGGVDLNTDAAVPADWLQANGGNIPNAPGCPAPQGGNTGRDTIMLKLRIRVPTNAQSFSAHVYFFSSEYPEWVCSPYNDFFLTLVDSAGAGNPADKNIAIYKNQNNQTFPLGVNILNAAPGLFTQCKNGAIGCGGGAVAGTYNGCVDNGELVGTGFDPLNPAPQFGGDPGYCGANNQVGGGTGWLKMSGNVQPGEVMELRFVLWDTGDEWYDSLVLIDNFEWSVQASQPGVQPG